jgi:hypothetical protein
MFGQPGYAAAAFALACLSAVAAGALRSGWDARPAALAWALALAAAVSSGRWMVAELGRPIDGTSAFALLLPIASLLVAWGALGLWRDLVDRRAERLRLVRAGAALALVGNGGFTVVAVAAGGWPIGLALVVGTCAAALLALAAHRSAAQEAGEATLLKRATRQQG